MVAATRNIAPIRSGIVSGILSEIGPLSKSTSGLKMLIYGVSGSGKTRLASTFRKPMLLVKADEGTGSIHNVKGIDEVPKNGRLIRADDVLALVAHQRESKKYKTFVFDHISAYQELVLSEVIGKPVPTQLGYREIHRNDWGKVAHKMKDVLRAVLELSDTCDILFIAQERGAKEGGEGSSDYDDMIIPFVNGEMAPSVAKWLNPEVDYICQTFKKMGTEQVKKKVGNKILETDVEKVQFCLRVGPHPIFLTKFRGIENMEQDYIIDPTYEKIAKLIG